MESSKFIHPLPEEDIKLFNRMKTEAISKEEAFFFRKMRLKEMYESTYSNELLVFERENTDKIFLLRKYYHTYLLGRYEEETYDYEVDSLSEILSLDLVKYVDYDRPITLFEWLREQNYACVRYNRNYDFM